MWFNFDFGLFAKRVLGSSIVRMVGLAAFLVTMAWVSGWILTYWANAHSAEWMQYLQFTDSSSMTTKLPAEPNPAAVRERLTEQYREVAGRAYMHFNIMNYFYTRYYMALILTAAAAVIAAFCLFHISKDGWKSARGSIQVLFTISAGTALLLGVFPALFRQDANIKDNRALYLQYVALANEIRTYMATGEAVLAADSTVTPTEFVWHVDKQLATLNAIPVGFDETKIPDYRTLELAKQE